MRSFCCLLLASLFFLSVGCFSESDEKTLPIRQVASPVFPDETPSPVPAPVITPTETATPGPLRIAVQPALSSALREAVATIPGLVVQENPEAPHDILLDFLVGRPVAEWIYAVAAPFPTLADNVSLGELHEAWDTGTLVLTNEAAALLSVWWGASTFPSTIVSEDALITTLWQLSKGPGDTVLTILPFDQLHPRLKVLQVDGITPVAPDFSARDYALSVSIGLQGNQADVEYVANAWSGPVTNRQRDKMSFVAMTGPSGMRRAVGDRMERHGLLYPVEETGPVLQSADIAHFSHENPFDPLCPRPTSRDNDNVCSPDHYIELMVWSGVTINELTGNHLNDRGPVNLLHTLDMYEQHGIQTFGGGRNLAEARQPLLIEHHGNRLAFTGCNPVGPWMAWARDDYPGSLPCEEDYAVLEAQIAELSNSGYLVIATLQYWEYYDYRVPLGQQNDFERLAKAGAVSVSGSQGHHPQGFGFYEDRFIHYGLGNMLADQMFSLGTRQMFINRHLFYDGRLLNVDLWTGINEDYARVRRMTEQERTELLLSVFGASIWTE